ncbi:MAG: HAD hydrolase-like protein [Acidimicrobiales bacterium]
MSPAASATTRVVLFDLDGCLLDSTEPIRRCLDAALADHGLAPIAADDFAHRVGPPLQVMLQSLLVERDAPLDLVDPLVESYRDRYRTVSIEMAVTYDGIPGALAAIGATERLGVCTSKPARWAVPILEHLGLAPLFEDIAGPGLTEAEPKSATMAGALDRLAPVDRPASVMIGDRHHDIDAARHHGLRSIGVTWGFGERSELEDAGADVVVDHPGQLTVALAAL